MSKYASEIEIGRYSSRETTGDSYSMIINCEEIARLDTAINFNGSFDQMARFINTLERNKPIIFIDSFNISKGPRTGDSNKVRITLSIFLRIPKDDTEQSDTETVNLSNNKIEDSA
jgi:Tfp pilus assembly protein PilO